MASTATTLFVLVSALGVVNSGYVITTPRRWTIGAPTQICASLTKGTFSSADSLKYSLTEVYHKAIIQNDTALVFPQGESFACMNLPVPSTTDRTITLTLKGTLASESVSDVANLTFVEGAERTFIQTDKYLYKPGQEVQFRILSVKNPNFTVVTEPYEEVYASNPSRTRIAQWKNVSNSAGLVHLAFNLHDEVVEGTYIIGAKFANKHSEEKIFRVEEYVLPRYEVTIEAPDTILGSDESVTLKVCARYTFGEPVKGNATVYLAAADSWKVYANLTENKQITGCDTFTYPSKDLLFDYNNCHIRIHNLQAYAVVVEDGTSVELHGRNNLIQVHRRAIQFRDKGSSTIKKPYLPAAAHIEAVFPNNSPAVNEVMEVCTVYNDENVCKNFTTDSKGAIHFVMPSQLHTRIEIKAVKYPKIERNWNDVMEESIFHKYSYNSEEYIDSTNSSLTIMMEKIKCTTGKDVNFTIPVIYLAIDQLAAKVNLQIASRGQVILTKITEIKFVEIELPIKKADKLLPLETVPDGMVLGVFEIPVVLTEQSSPKISILVWYTNEDGSVVADASEVEVSECLPHKVDFTWSKEKAEPGQEANLIIKGANDALCSIGVVDKSVDLLSAENNKLAISSLLQLSFNSEVARWDDNQLNLEYCYRKYNYSTNPNTTTSPSTASSGAEPEKSKSFVIDRPYNRYSMMEAIHMFINAGYYVMSNLILEKRFCDELIIQDMKTKASALNPSIQEDEAGTAHRLPAASPAFFGGGGGGGFGGASIADGVSFQAGPSLEKSPSPANKEGEVEETQERSYLPETWLWLLKPLSPTGELNEAMTLPDTITEWVGNAVCVHPTEGVGTGSSSITTFTPFFVDLTLPSSATRGEILPVKISIFNYLPEDIPVKITVEKSSAYKFSDGETGTRELCIPSKDKSVETVKIKLTKLGDINITVEALAQPLSSGSCGSGSPPAKKDRLIRQLPVDPEGYLKEKTFTQYFCSEDLEIAEAPPADFWVNKLPASTVEGSARSWITAIGDLMGPTLENIGNLIRFPSGCGEQNMINFAPNIYILQYLDASNQTTSEIKEKITKFLNHGYQRQLLFRRGDGSYSTFGESDKEGSTWLTAFVVKSFAQAKNYTLIDEESLDKSVAWLKALQNENGCFKSQGRVINKMLQGGITGSEAEGLLTAYVLAALLEEGNVTEEMKLSAIKCIETNSSEHPYSLALKSYSLALANSSNAKTIVDKLLGLAASNTSMLRWDLPDREGTKTALHVETAAYALLGLVNTDYHKYKTQARKIVRWISSLRNGQGGFISTQDTVVALQALAAIEKAQPRSSLDMEINLSASNFTHSFKVTDDNKFLQQLVNVPKIPTNITLTIGGTGCALIQGVLRYNILSDSTSKVLTLKVDTAQTEGKDCKTQNITACATYNLPDGASNMAIMEFKLMTGYIPIKQDLKDIVGDGRGNFKRYEVDGPKVTFYVEELTRKETCAGIRVYQEVEIENAKPGSVTVYDYYQPEYIITQKYNISTNCLAGA